MKRRYLRYFSWYRGTAIYRDLGDTGIVTCGIAILTEVSRVSHNTTTDTVIGLRCVFCNIAELNPLPFNKQLIGF